MARCLAACAVLVLQALTDDKLVQALCFDCKRKCSSHTKSSTEVCDGPSTLTCKIRCIINIASKALEKSQLLDALLGTG